MKVYFFLIFVSLINLCTGEFKFLGVPINPAKIFSDFTSGLVAPNALVKTPDLLISYGYPVEIHEVRTEDRYIVELHRIPSSPYSMTNTSSSLTTRPIVFLMHSIFCSSADFIYTGPNRSLALFLADAGYDVWLGNARGNSYSTKHTLWKRNDPKYWQFSYHEIGYYDLAASIDYILQTTNRYFLYYIGYGQGNTALYVLLSSRPEYNRKIKLGINMSPSAFFTKMSSKLLKFFMTPFFVYPVSSITNQFGYFPFHINNFLLAMIGKYFCGERSLTRYACTWLIFKITGNNLRNFDFKLLPVILGHTPDSVSIKQLLHYGQGTVSGKFSPFDHGYTTNYLVYDETEPPNYELSNVTAPLVLYSASNDFVSNPADTMLLADKLGTKPTQIIVPDINFNHIDFLWGLNAPEILYSEIIQLIQNN